MTKTHYELRVTTHRECHSSRLSWHTQLNPTVQGSDP